jgi:23S rRNA pseudouridine1911/1915/1917 synthase
MRIPSHQKGERLDVVLGEHVGSRAAAQRLIDAGLVTVDGEPRQKRYKVAEGQTLEWGEIPDSTPEPKGDAPFTIAYEADDFLVVDKPAGVVAHPARGHQSGTLAEAVGGHLVHRLDKNTSGLLIVATTEAAHRRLKQKLQDREITREYLALVKGRPPSRTGTIDAPIGRDRKQRTRHSTDTDSPRDAVTHFEIEQALPHTTLLRVRLETGRTHQIRVHLEAIGHPVIGDPEYGVPDPELKRQFLHATRLRFDDVDVTSPLPEDLEMALLRATGRPIVDRPVACSGVRASHRR